MYVGLFKKNMKHAKDGTFTWPTGATYNGGYRKGLRSGKGIYVWPDGEKYEGTWKKDLKSGKGMKTWPDGQEFYD